MFVLADDITFMHQAVAQVPNDQGHEEQTFRARFTVRGDSEVAHFNLSNREDTIAFLKLVVVGFEDVLDRAKQPVPYSDATRDKLFDLPFVRIALVKAYFAGMFKAQTGN